MKIEIRSLEVEAIIGILPEERHTPQKVLIDLEAEYRYQTGKYLDYTLLVTTLRHTLITGKFGLLEEALPVLKEHVMEEHPEIFSLFIRLSKPEILPECIVAVSERWVD